MSLSGTMNREREERSWAPPSSGVFNGRSGTSSRQHYEAFEEAAPRPRYDGSARMNRQFNQEASSYAEAQNVRDRLNRISSGADAGRASVRRANLAYGMDISQRYDAFGNNSFSSADNAWAAFFGAPSQPWKTSSYDKYDRSNYNLPDAYTGKNETLAQTIDELIYSDETFYTTVLLPFNFTDNLSIQWDKWEFNEHFTGIVPEQGVSRLVSSHRESRSESFVRRGLAAMFEHGFISTPEGRAHYFLTLAQIARAVQETLNFGVIYAYLTCHNYAKTWEARHGYFRKQTLRELLERECFMWAIAVTQELGMEKLDCHIVEWMNRYNVTADTWVLPPKPAMYLSLVPAEKIYHYLAGDEGPRRVNDIVGAGRPHEANAPGKRLHDIVEPYALFKNNRVYLTRTYNVDATGPIDLMTRVSTVGEYFKVIPNINSHACRNGQYMSCDMDRKVYDEDNDTGYVVNCKEALKYCQVFKEDGTPNEPGNMVAPADANDLRQVFFFRSERDLNGSESFVPISYMGDIDRDFIGPDTIVNLAYTAVHSALGEKQKEIRDALRQGLQLINAWAEQLVVAPAPAAGGGGGAPAPAPPAAGGGGGAPAPAPPAAGGGANAGRTTWVELTGIALNAGGAGATEEDSKIQRFVEAVETIAEELGRVFQGQSNLFLDRHNSLPYAEYGPISSARTLYENVIKPDLVPLVRVGDYGNPGGQVAVLAPLFEAYNGAILDSSTEKDRPKIEEKVRKGEIPRAADADRVRDRLRDLTGRGLTSATYADAKAVLDTLSQFLIENLPYTQAKDRIALMIWLGQMQEWERKLIELAGVSGGRSQQRDTTEVTTLAVSRNSQWLENGDIAAQGYAPMSSIVRRQGARARRLVDATGVTTFTGIASRAEFDLMSTPIFKGLAAAQNSHSRDLTGVNEEYGGQFGTVSVEKRAHGGSGGGLDEFGDDDITGGAGGSAGIGAMFGRGAGGAELDQEALAELTARQNWVPQAGAGFLDTVHQRFANMGYNTNMVGNHTSDELVRIAAFLYYGSPWRAQTLETFYDNNIVFPTGFLGFRWGMYDMALGIKCKAGSATGATYFGHSDFLLSDDAAIKVHYGHYTHYGKSVIHHEENVFVAYDIFPNKILGGMGMMPYEHRGQYNPSQQVFERDVFYIMVPFNEKYFEKVINAAGRFYTYMDAGMLDDLDPANRRLHYTTAAFYARVWGWSSDEEIPLELDEPMYRINNPGVCLNLWQGAQGSYNRKEDNFNKDIIRNKGPWKISAEGCRGARNGEMTRMPTVLAGQLGF